MKLIKNTVFFLLVAIVLLSLAPVAYRLIPFGSGRTVDTAYAKGSIRVDSVLRIVALSKADTNWVLGVNDSGFLCWRYRSGSGSNLATGDQTANADHTHDWGGYSSTFQNVNTWAMDDTDGNRFLAFNLAATGMVNADVIGNSWATKTWWGSVGASGSNVGGLKKMTAANGLGNSLIFKSASTYDSLNLRLGGLLYLSADSVTGRVGVHHLGGIKVLTSGTLGTGAGTGASYSISGTDLSGYVSVTTGTGCATDATIITLTYGTAFQSVPYIILIPGNKLTQNLAKGQEVFVDQSGISTTTFVIKSNGTALADASVYIWRYIIVQ